MTPKQRKVRKRKRQKERTRRKKIHDAVDMLKGEFFTDKPGWLRKGSYRIQVLGDETGKPPSDVTITTTPR